jgi:hypothetical protein
MLANPRGIRHRIATADAAVIEVARTITAV